jgi:hypothetical protein
VRKGHRQKYKRYFVFIEAMFKNTMDICNGYQAAISANFKTVKIKQTRPTISKLRQEFGLHFEHRNIRNVVFGCHGNFH